MMKSIKIKVLPSSEQKELLDSFGDGYNYMYNKAVTYLKSNFPGDGSKISLSKYDIRDKLATQNTRKGDTEWLEVSKVKTDASNNLKRAKSSGEGIEEAQNLYDIAKSNYQEAKRRIDPVSQLNLYESSIPKDIRALAVCEAYTKFVTGNDGVASKRFSSFDLSLRTKKDLRTDYTISIPPSMIKISPSRDSLYLTSTKIKDHILRMNTRSLKDLDKIDKLKEIKLCKVDGKYFMFLPCDVDIQKKRDVINFIGLDPGCSTFLTGFSNDGVVKYQQGDQLNSINKRIDYLKTKHRKRKIKKLRRVLTRLETRKKNLVSNLHWQVISDLVKKYDLICIEKFDSKRIVAKEGSLHSSSSRRLMDMSHFSFREKLLYKAESQGVDVKVVPSFNTSKHCSSCGTICENMTLDIRHWTCNSCHSKSCRDINAAKNILMFGLAPIY